jgi:hypothetical protein
MAATFSLMTTIFLPIGLVSLITAVFLFTRDLRKAAIIPMILAIVFISAAAGFYYYPKYQQSKIEHLKQIGQVVESNYVKTEIVKNVTVNGQHPYQLYTVTVNSDTLEEKVYKSSYLWSKPPAQIPAVIKVYIDPQNPKNYWVDTSFWGGQ